MVALIRILVINGLVLAGLLALFDVAAFHFVPRHFVANLENYRRQPPPTVYGRGVYPHEYFTENDERGFDIGKNRKGFHWVDGVLYQIWSNSIGCFDREHNSYDGYIYFAGDSYTWGYAPYEQKFGTIIEQATGATILKCGVTHTGQRHQYSKFIELVRDIGHLPQAVFIFYTNNDVANDFAHPHSTVIQGWQVDTLYLDGNYKKVRRTQKELEVKTAEHIKRVDQQNRKTHTLWSEFKNALKYYSLSLNIIYYIENNIVQRLYAYFRGNEAHDSNKSDSVHRSAENNLYSLPQEKNGKYWFADNQNAQNNKEAMLNFRDFSNENGIALTFVLIPPKEKYVDFGYFQEVRAFLENNGIGYLDLTSRFKQAGVVEEDLYWDNDAHLNPSGNEVVAEILISEFPHIFGAR